MTMLTPTVRITATPMTMAITIPMTGLTITTMSMSMFMPMALVMPTPLLMTMSRPMARFIDTSMHVEFDVERAIANARMINPEIKVLTVSARTGEGLGDWYGWLREQRVAAREAALV
jgi:hypothetical protein